MIKEWDLECFELFLIYKIEKSNHLKTNSKSKNSWKKILDQFKILKNYFTCITYFPFLPIFKNWPTLSYSDSRTKIKGNARQNNSQEF